MKISIIIMIMAGFFSTVFSQDAGNQVHFNIPGNNQINTEDTIQKLLLIKKIPIQKKEAEIQDYKLESDIARDITKYLRDLDDKSRALYDFKTPFRDMVGTSSDPAVLEVSAERKAKKEDYKIKVLQTAKPDSFMSSSYPKNKALPPCEFTVSIGGKSFKFKFAGGTIYQLADALQQQARDVIDTRIINDTDTSSILVISGKDTGEKNKLNFSGDISALREINLLGEGEPKTDEKKIDFSRLSAKSANPISSDSNRVRLMPGDEGEVNLLQENIRISEGTVFYFNALMRPYNPAPAETNINAPNLDINLMEPVSVSNVTVSGGSLISYFEENKKAPEIISNYTEILTLSFDDGTGKSYYIDNTGNFSNSLGTYKDKTVVKLTVRNKNTDREFLISDARLVTKISEGGIQPKNIISRACDSIINFDGVEVKRDKNIIDNLIDGVTITLKSESKEPVTASIDHNYKKIEDSLSAWIESYNKTMEYLHVVTTPNLDHTPLSQRSQDNLKIGAFQAESPVIILMNRLREIPSAPYKTIYDRQLSLLEQIGIFTKRNGSFDKNSDEWNSARIGLLNFELEKFRSELKTRFEGVEQLFAYDTHGDLIKDSGAAVAINQTLRLSLGAGSFFEERIVFNNNKIKDGQKDIEKMNRDLVIYEQDLREKYGKMNQVLTETANKEKWLNSQMKNNEQ